MAYERPLVEPSEHEAGTTLAFDRNLPDYPADTWTLSYELRSDVAAPISITATASGTTHKIDVTSAVTATWTSGTYLMSGYVTDGTDTFAVYREEIKILTDVSATASFDHRSWVKRMLDTLEDVIAGRIAQSDVSYSINGRSISKMTHEDLFVTRDRLRAEWRQEELRGKQQILVGRFLGAK